MLGLFDGAREPRGQEHIFLAFCEDALTHFEVSTAAESRVEYFEILRLIEATLNERHTGIVALLPWYQMRENMRLPQAIQEKRNARKRNVESREPQSPGEASPVVIDHRPPRSPVYEKPMITRLRRDVARELRKSGIRPQDRAWLLEQEAWLRRVAEQRYLDTRSIILPRYVFDGLPPPGRPLSRFDPIVTKTLAPLYPVGWTRFLERAARRLVDRGFTKSRTTRIMYTLVTVVLPRWFPPDPPDTKPKGTPRLRGTINRTRIQLNRIKALVHRATRS
jgi:hypothetical protein